jgi:hypothetical protein
MSSQIFKHQVSKQLLFDLLEKICQKTKDYYIFNKIAFKKGEYSELIEPFINELIPAYHKSKQFYLTRKRTYISFVTIIRQLCKLNSVNYKSNISYTKSTYDIVYNIMIE